MDWQHRSFKQQVPGYHGNYLLITPNKHFVKIIEGWAWARIVFSTDQV
jgi:hypothetical protein